MHIERHSPRRRNTGGAVLKFFVLILAAAALGLAGTAVAITLNGSAAAADFGPPAADLNPAERVSLSLYLSLNKNALNTPAGIDSTAVNFTIDAGENAGTVAAKLQEMGLVTDADLLRLYMRYKGSDDQIEAGNFSLNATMTIPAIAAALADATPLAVTVRVWEGWRVEQIAESLTQQPDLAFNRDDFARMIAPGGDRTGSYSFLGDIPATSSLEGFLFPDTYILSPGTPTAEILNRFLVEFDQKVTTQMRADAAAQGLTLYQVITLASIVEREAVHDDERPVIASVYLNRLASGMKLDADPTTQYAIATPDNWWPPLNLDPRTVDHPYNTYVYEGLPPGPIANPGLSSINAVIYPAQTDYYFFRARCDGSKYHNFSTTYEEHVAHGCP